MADTALLSTGPRKLEFGYFYNLRFIYPPDIVTEFGIDRHAEWIFSNEAREREHVLSAEVISPVVPDSELGCPKDRSHTENFYHESVTVYCQGDGTLTPIVSCGLGHHVLSKSLAERLVALEVKGYRQGKVIVAYDFAEEFGEADRPDLQGMVYFGSTAMPAIARFQIPEGVPNACPYCQKSQVVCDGCGDLLYRCSVCENRVIVGKDEEGPFKLKLEDVRTTFIDPKLWDGSDVMPNGFVTRRVLDFLLSVHAWPFAAKPIGVNVLDLSEEDRKRLKAAKRPLQPRKSPDSCA